MRYGWSLLLFAVASSAFAGNVDTVKNVSYFTGPGADDVRHRLDLYLPSGAVRCPVVVFVHGGGWLLGSKDMFLPGLRPSVLGQFFAERGIAAVFVNYRLSPKVKHPDHVTDVARAVGWVRRNIGRFGGDEDRLFLMGHSAGGHLVALVTCDPRYLMVEGLTPAMIKGVIPVSGVFALTAELGPAAGPAERPNGPGALFGQVFGNDPVVHRQASPVQHVRADLPPFLVTYADRDMLTLAGQGEAFQEALAAKGAAARKLLMNDRTHLSILRNMVQPGDPLGEAVLAFIRSGKP
jgi:acetyl esterase/lipase